MLTLDPVEVRVRQDLPLYLIITDSLDMFHQNQQFQIHHLPPDLSLWYGLVVLGQALGVGRLAYVVIGHTP